MAEEKPANNEEQKPESKLPMKAIIVVLGILLLEGAMISIFWVTKGGPAPAEASDPINQTQETPNKDMVEVILASDMSVDNYSLGKTRIVITLQVAAKTARSKETQLKEAVGNHNTEIRDTIRVSLSSADPTDLKDAKLEVIKREIKTGVELIIGSGLIEEILLPIWQSYTAD